MSRRRRTPAGGVEVEVEVPCNRGFRHPVTLAIKSWLKSSQEGTRQADFEIKENRCSDMLFGLSAYAHCNKYLNDFMVNFLDDQFIELRRTIVECLRGNREALDILLIAMEEWKRPVWETAIESLSAIGEEAVHPTSSRLRHVNPYVRWRATRVLGEIGSQSAKPFLVRELNKLVGETVDEEDDDPEALSPSQQYYIIWAILEALGNIDGTGLISPLAQHIRAENRYVACSAVNSLVRIIRNHIDRINQSEAEEYHQILLAEISQGVDFLISSLCVPDLYVRRAIVNGLVQIGRPAVPKLIGGMMNPRRPWLVRVKCAQIIGLIGDPRAFPALKRTLRSANWGLRAESAIALAHLATESQKQTVRTLIEQRLSEESDERVLKALNEALGIM